MNISLAKKFAFFIVTLILSMKVCALPTLLPVPHNLIAFNSPAGIKLFNKSQHKTAFWELIPYFTTEKGVAFCGVAASVMVLNAVNIKPPITPSHSPFYIFNQDNFFTESVLKVITPAEINSKGATLSQIAQSLKTFNIFVKMYHGREEGMDKKLFRRLAIGAVSSSHKFIIVNFCRKYIKEQGCGHFSPLAAYNAKADRFLLLDVARYKYLPVWIKTDELYQSLSKGNDPVAHKSRGFIIVSSKG
ncbi:phytochelatin synthase family protein [Coxiella burnetii]|nr:phytochelatin synthase family protein [Coxiella burnetii]